MFLKFVLNFLELSLDQDCKAEYCRIIVTSDQRASGFKVHVAEAACSLYFCGPKAVSKNLLKP